MWRLVVMTKDISYAVVFTVDGLSECTLCMDGDDHEKVDAAKKDEDAG